MLRNNEYHQDGFYQSIWDDKKYKNDQEDIQILFSIFSLVYYAFLLEQIHIYPCNTLYNP